MSKVDTSNRDRKENNSGLRLRKDCVTAEGYGFLFEVMKVIDN